MRNSDQILRVIGYQGWGILLNRLSRVLAKNGFDKNVHTCAWKKVQGPH